ncbi:MAG: isoprenylcysteine carboxylmethyltransferase family protein [Pseudomonadota bacterium]
MTTQDHIERLWTLIRGVFTPAPGLGRIALALSFGLVVHVIFAVAVMAMIVAMFFGMSESLGAVPYPYAIAVNAALVLQFPIAHSALLSGPGMRLLSRLVPGPHGGTLSTTTFAIIASLQLFLLFAFWTPSGIVWWRADGWAFWALCGAYAVSWLLLLKASWDAGAEVQAGALGWMTLMKNSKLRFPDMPTGGLFRLIRQPIYLSFALTLWTVPVWTPDQLALAVVLTAYCLAAPKLKERRFEKRYGQRFRDYRRDVPYMVPDLAGERHDAARTQ